MSRPRASLSGRAVTDRLSYSELTTAQKKKFAEPFDEFEPCYVVYNGNAFNLNSMVKANPDRVPIGWHGRQGDVIYRDNFDDTIEMGLVER